MPCKPLRTLTTAVSRRGMAYFRPEEPCSGWSFTVPGRVVETLLS